MPQLIQLDATEMLPSVVNAGEQLDQYREATQRYAGHIEGTTALTGPAREALAHNAQQIAAAGVRAHAWVSLRINGIRQIIEYGIHTAAHSAGHANSVEIPRNI